MPADVVKRAQLAIAGANNKDIFVAQPERYIVTRFGLHRFVRDVLPGSVENPLFFKFEQVCGKIVFR